MLGFAAVVVAVVCVGFAAVELLQRKLQRAWSDDSEPLERLTAAALAGGSLWIAANWLLALTGTLTRTALLGVSAAFCVVAVVVFVRGSQALRSYELPRSMAVQLALATPLLLWIVFILWRGSVLPPLSHDALAYHLPKAVLLARAHAFDYFVAPDLRISHLPANYELLLADVLLLSGTDRLTEWIGTTTFILFLLACGAVAQRWWRSGLHVVPAIVMVATAPVLLLHSGADKNDLMIAFLAVCALLWGARWATEGGTLTMVLLVTALTTGAGTKPQQGAVLIGLLPFLIRRCVAEARSNRRALLRFAAIGIAAVLWFGITGGAAYAFNAVHESSPLEVGIGATAANEPTGVFQYGDVANLWQFPILLLMVPFSKWGTAVWVPWRGEYWFWPHYELYFSHYGIAVTLLAVACPFCAWYFRRHNGRPHERLVYTVAALVAFFLTLPVQFRPVGTFASFPRYVLYVLPMIVCWTLPPLFRSRERLGPALLLMIAAGFSMTAVNVARFDQFAPLPYVRWVVQNPGTRVIYTTSNRAASVVDRMAGPRDTIAVDGSFDTWLHPAFGPRLTRPIVFLNAAAGARAAIPADAQWVIVDRSWTALWGHPRFADMGDFWQFRGKGTPSTRDLAIYNQLLADPRFVLVYRDEKRNQAVFWRRLEGVAAPRPPLVRFHVGS